MSEFKFTKEDAAIAIVWLVENKVSSFSPETSKLLLEISQAIKKKLVGHPHDGIYRFLDSYATMLYSVSVVGHLHQGAVISQLEWLLKKEKKVL